MFLDSHYLYTVISVFNNSWKDVFTKFVVGPDFLGILCHTYMAFVYKQRVGMRNKFMFECIGFIGKPYLCRKYFGVLILNDSCCPSWNALSASAIPMNH